MTSISLLHRLSDRPYRYHNDHFSRGKRDDSSSLVSAIPRILDLSCSSSLPLSATHFCIPSEKTNQASLCRKIPCTSFFFFGIWNFTDYGFEIVFWKPSLPLITTSIPPLRLPCDIYLEFCFGILMGLRCPHTRMLRCPAHLGGMICLLEG